MTNEGSDCDTVCHMICLCIAQVSLVEGVEEICRVSLVPIPLNTMKTSSVCYALDHLHIIARIGNKRISNRRHRRRSALWSTTRVTSSTTPGADA